MQTYKNLNRNSNIKSYEILGDGIVVKFNDNSRYLYNNSKPGVHAVNEMKRLAIQGRGLNSYINKVIKNKYVSKLN